MPPYSTACHPLPVPALTPPSGPSISDEQRATIEEAVKQAAWSHLRAGDADTALSYYEPGAVVASNGELYPSFSAFAHHVRTFYRTLREVHLAAWDQMHVDVLSERAAVLTATFRWSSTDTEGVRLDLRGVWTAVSVLRQGRWRVLVRHESFMRIPREG